MKTFRWLITLTYRFGDETFNLSNLFIFIIVFFNYFTRNVRGWFFLITTWEKKLFLGKKSSKMGSKFCNPVWSIIMKFEQHCLVLRCFEGNNICCNILSRSKKRHITNREIINRKVGALILISSFMLQLLKAKIQKNASAVALTEKSRSEKKFHKILQQQKISVCSWRCILAVSLDVELQLQSS